MQLRKLDTANRRFGNIEIAEHADEYIKVNGFGSLCVVKILGFGKMRIRRDHV